MIPQVSYSRLTYKEARARLYSLEHWGIKLGLDNIRDFCSLLGDPQDRFASVHVAGTNGKGSTSAYIDSILRSSGYKVGRYTSPHLRDFRERIHINGSPVSAKWVAEFVAVHWGRIVEKKYSYFEVTTALAFHAFARAKVDLAVIEVGLGGRFDATNVINPVVSVITRIARDHEHVLGHTAAEIAFEKAGIVKPGVPVVIGPLVEEAESRIQEIADERLAPLWSAAEVLSEVSERKAERGGLRVPLSGNHQLTNLATALATIEVLRSSGVDVSTQDIRGGVSRTQWPARFQIAKYAGTVVYDAGHNPDGANAIVATWKQVFAAQKCVCVFNTRPDKNHEEMIAVLSEIVSGWVFCPMPDSPFISRDDLLALASRRTQPADWCDSPEDAMQAARVRAGSGGVILVTGSHYLVGAVIPQRFVTHPDSRRASKTVTWPQLLAAARDRGAAF